MSNDLIQEVEDSLRKEKMDKFWKEYGPYIIAGAVMAVLLTGLIGSWRVWNHAQNEASTNLMLETTIEAGQIDALEEVIPEMRPGHRALSHLSAAGVLLEDGDSDAALSHYRQAAADRSAPSPYRELAALLAVRLEWSLERPDTDARALINALDPLLRNRNSPWHYHAQLQAAQITAHDHRDYAGARQYLAPVLRADGLPQSLTERAQRLDHLYGLRAEQAATAPQITEEEPAG